jgi:hypothetical protein
VAKIFKQADTITVPELMQVVRIAWRERKISLITHLRVLVALELYPCFLIAFFLGFLLRGHRRTEQFYGILSNYLCQPMQSSSLSKKVNQEDKLESDSLQKLILNPWEKEKKDKEVEVEEEIGEETVNQEPALPVSEALPCPFNAEVEQELNTLRGQFLSAPERCFPAWERIYATIIDNLPKASDDSWESGWAWVVQWMCKRDENGRSLAVPLSAEDINLFLAVGMENDEIFSQNMLQLCEHMPQSAFANLAISSTSPGGTCVGILLVSEKNSPRAENLICGLSNEDFIDIFSKEGAFDNVINLSSRKPQQAVIARLAGLPIDNLKHICQMYSEKYQNYAVVNSLIHFGHYDAVINVLKSLPLDQRNVILRFCQRENEEQLGIELLEEVGQFQQQKAVAELLIQATPTDLKKGAESVIEPWRYDTYAGIATIRFLIKLANGNLGDRSLLKQLLEVMPDDALIHLKEILEDRNGVMYGLNLDFVWSFLERSRLTKIQQGVTSDLICMFLSDLVHQHQDEAVAWRIYLDDVINLSDDRGLPDDKWKIIVQKLLKLTEQDWNVFFAQSSADELRMQLERKVKFCQDNKDMMLALQARCEKFILPKFATVQLETTFPIEILKKRAAVNPINGNMQLLIKEATALCTLLQNRSRGNPLEEQMVEEMWKQLFKMLWDVAQLFPIPEDTLKNLQQVCHGASGYCTTCIDALQTSKEYFEGMLSLTPLDGAESLTMEAKLQRITRLWLLESVHELLIYLQGNEEHFAGIYEPLELALMSLVIFCKTGGLPVPPMSFANCGTRALCLFSTALETYGIPIDKNTMLSLKEVKKSFPTFDRDWDNRSIFVDGAEVKAADLKPFFLCLMWWLSKSGHSLNDVLLKNEGWAMALVPDVNALKVSECEGVSSEIKPFEKSKKVIEMLQAKILEAEKGESVPEATKLAFNELKDKINNLASRPQEMTVQKFSDLLRWLFETGVEGNLIPDPIDYSREKTEHVLNLSEEDTQMLTAIFPLFLGSGSETRLRQEAMLSCQMQAYCAKSMRKFHVSRRVE